MSVGALGAKLMCTRPRTSSPTLRISPPGWGKDSVTTRDVNRDGKINQNTIVRRFGSFSEALIQAGLKPTRTYRRSPDRMLTELASLVRRLGRTPSKTEVNKNLSYNARHYETEFGSINQAIGRLKQRRETAAEGKQPSESGTLTSSTLSRTSNRRRYGPTINFRGLRHAPVNENGVVFLFGMLAEELGFVVESIQTGFPDCDAKLRRSDGTFEGVRIEFEFQSSSFLRHGHDPAKCDLIVCWQHDWSDCPIDVIDLSRVTEERGER